MLVVLEGLEGVGKTTLGALIAKSLGAVYLKSPPPEMNDPREYIAGVPDPRCSFYFYLSSLYAMQPRIEEAIATGRWVVADRYLMSTIGYHDRGRSFDPPAFDASGLRDADLSVHLRCGPTVRGVRLGDRGFHIFNRAASNDAAIESYFEQRCDLEFWNNGTPQSEANRLAELISDRLG